MNGSADSQLLNEVIDKAEHLTRYGTMLLALIGENLSAKAFVKARWKENLADDAQVVNLDASNMFSLACLLDALNEGFGFELEKGEEIKGEALEQFTDAINNHKSELLRVCIVEKAEVLDSDCVGFLVALSQRLASRKNPLRFFLIGEPELEPSILTKAKGNDSSYHILLCPDVEAEVPMAPSDFQDTEDEWLQFEDQEVDAISEPEIIEEQEIIAPLDDDAPQMISDLSTHGAEDEESLEDDDLPTDFDPDEFYNKNLNEKKKKWPVWVRLAFGFAVANLAVLAVAVGVYFQGGDFVKKIEDDIVSLTNDKNNPLAGWLQQFSQVQENNQVASKEASLSGKDDTLAPVTDSPAQREVIEADQIEEPGAEMKARASSLQGAQSQSEPGETVAIEEVVEQETDEPTVVVARVEMAPTTISRATEDDTFSDADTAPDEPEQADAPEPQAGIAEATQPEPAFKEAVLTKEEEKKLAIVEKKAIPQVKIEKIPPAEDAAGVVSPVGDYQVMDNNADTPQPEDPHKASVRLSDMEAALLDKDGRHYALQLISLSNELKVKELINQYDLGEKAIYYRGLLNGKTAFFLIYGEFPTLKDATWARDHWPEHKGDFNPFVKRISWAKRQLNEVVN